VFKFVVLEGIDGSGKTTLAKTIEKKTKENGEYKDFIFTKEPFTPVTLSDDPDITLNNMCLSHYFHTEILLNPNYRKKHIVCDRYTGSRFAYQSVQNGIDYLFMENLDTNDIESIKQFYESHMFQIRFQKLHEHTINPDAVFFINTTPEEAFKRTTDRHDKTIYDMNFDFLEKVYDRYISMVKHHFNWYVLDGNEEPDFNAVVVLDYLYGDAL